MEENENWQKLMFSCRQACKILNTDFKEPMYLDWDAGRNYHDALWGRIRARNKIGVK